MNDIILSSLLNLFALFGKEVNTEKELSKKNLVSYMRRHFGIRNVDFYLELYDDLRTLYDDSPDIDPEMIIESICTNLHGKIHATEETMMLLRLMEFCGVDKHNDNEGLKIVAEKFNVPQSIYDDFCDFVCGHESQHVLLHELEGFDGTLKTLYEPQNNLLIFTYTGGDQVLLNDVPVLSGTFQVWQQSGVLKNHKGTPLYYSAIRAKHDARINGGEVERSAVEFCGRDINFRFPNSDNGMHDLSFTLRSGELLAIMGGSGTGKSTLLSLLNGSNSPQEGTITINGHDISEPEAKSLIGFVPQDDLLIEELTVYQNLWFTAKLCFEGMPDAEIDARVLKTLKDLGLDAAKDLKVGSAIEKYISGGQRKRLNIALELIREPAVLFLDEPTSGLSSADTEKVINLLKEQTYKGKLIVVNIHQPSSDVYKLFDRLWLLDKGGYPVFDGNPIDAITYFKRAANYADAETSACPTCGNVNPEVVLNIIDEKSLNDIGETSDKRKVTPQEWHKLYLDNREAMDQPAVTDVPHSDQKKPGKLKQFAIFLHRNVKTKITNMQYLAITLLEAPILAMVCALLTRYAPPEGYSIMNNKNLVSYFFMAVIVATFIGMSGSAEEIIKDRALLKREKFLRLSYSSYIWSKIVYMGGVSLVQTLLFVLVGNMVMGIHDLLPVWWLILFVTAFLSNLVGLLLSQCLSSVVAIYISIPMLLIPQILLCGLVVSFSDLTPKSTTGNVPVIGDLIPSRWAYEALAVTSFTDNEFEANFFDLDKVKYENQFYSYGILKELKSQMQTELDEKQRGKEVNPLHAEVIEKNLPVLTEFCQLEPYDKATPLADYLAKAEDILTKRGNIATLDADKRMSAFVRKYGKEEMVQLKRDHYNLQLENFVVGADQQRLLDVIDGYIVPRAGFVYLTPRSTCGRAPFYSSEKIVGTTHVKTLWYNLCVLLAMCLFVAGLLFADCPGRWVRKEVN